MKANRFVRILVSLSLVIFSIGNAFAYDPIGSSVSITSQGRIALTPGPYLDGFSAGTSINFWGDITSAFAKGGSTATCTASYENNPSIAYGRSGYSLKLDYDVRDAESFAGYSSRMGSGTNLRMYNYLSFWVKGLQGGEYFKTEIHHADYDPDRPLGQNNNYHSHVYINEYLRGGVTTNWQKVVIPLDAFGNISDWSSINELVFVFENSQCITNNSRTRGTVYIDNISFGYQFLEYVLIDSFDDKVGVNSLGGNCGNTSGNPAGGEVYGSFDYTDAGELWYYFENVFDPRYYAYFSVIGGGDSGFVAQPRDFSRYDKMVFTIKSSAANLNCIKVQLNCPTFGQGNFFRFLKNVITNDWRMIEIPLTHFTTSGWVGNGQNVVGTGKIRELGEVVFVRDGWMSKYADWDGGVQTGTFWIRSVQLLTDTYSEDTTPPNAPSAPSTTGDVIVTLTSTADSRMNDSSMENVRFEYNDGGVWKAIQYAFDTSDRTYVVRWDTGNLAPGTYQIRAVAMDTVGKETRSALSTHTVRLK